MRSYNESGVVDDGIYQLLLLNTSKIDIVKGGNNISGKLPVFAFHLGVLSGI